MHQKERAKAGRIVSLTGYRRKLYVGFCLKPLTSIDDINFTDLDAGNARVHTGEGVWLPGTKG